MREPRWRLIYLGIALTTLATLVLELSLTRIFSVVFHYHYAFLAISIALFGLGVGGLFSYYVLARKTGSSTGWLGTISLLNSASVVGALTYLVTRSGGLSGGTLFLVYLSASVPFFLAGIVVSSVIAETVKRVDRVYAADLIGAGGGCILLVPLLNHLGAPNTVIAAGVLFALSGVVWYTLSGRGKSRAVAVLVTSACCAFIAYNSRQPVLDLRYAKGTSLSGELYSKWNSFSRVGLTVSTGTVFPAIIRIDGDADTPVAGFDLEHPTEAERTQLFDRAMSLPYALRPGAKTLIIGPGGGWDIAKALAHGSRDVTGVEINPIIARVIMQEKYPSMSRNLYLRPEVRIVVEEGRSFIRNSREKYQVLQATLVDTWAATEAGAFSLSENSLYTVEAFCEYLSHLTDDGLMAFTRWGFEPPRESLRLVTLGVEALKRLGRREPWRHVIAARETVQPNHLLDTVIVSRTPLTDEDVSVAQEFLRSRGIQALHLPGLTADNPFSKLLRDPNPERFIAAYPYRVAAVDDNSPFFFYTVQPRDIWEFLKRPVQNGMDSKVNQAIPKLFGLLVVSLMATGLILVLPRLVLEDRLPQEPATLRFLWYFVFIGVGYILIQIALVQKFVLFLGHPTYALTVIIFSMLVASGVGSRFSGRVVACSDRRLILVLAAVAALVAALAMAVSSLAAGGLGWPKWIKIALTVFVIAPVGAVMGMPFPSGLARLELSHRASVRWAWSLNAAASVSGSALAVALAIYLGLRETLLIGGGMYLCAAVSVALSRRKAERPETLLEVDSAAAS